MTAVHLTPAVPLVLAGAPARDRRVIAQPGSVARWFEPFHVRQPQVARAELAAQVAAGVDVIVAPAWITHHRALEPVGESRRARAWTTAAVRLAREAVELGLERRVETAHAADPPGRPYEAPVLVVAPLPDVAARPEGAHGRLLPADAAAARDLHDQAGLLADAEVDAVLIEPRPSTELLRQAVETVAGTGRPAWVMLAGSTLDGTPRTELTAILRDSGATRILLPATSAAAGDAGDRGDAAGDLDHPSGRWWSEPSGLPDAETLDRLLATGTDILGLVSEATASTMAPLLEARDRALATRLAQQATTTRDLAAWLREAARRAPGGRALWLGQPDVPLPSGFAWTVETSDTWPGAPDATFALVATDRPMDAVALARCVAEGGIAAIVGPPDILAPLSAMGLQPQVVEDRPPGIRVIARREPG